MKTIVLALPLLACLFCLACEGISQSASASTKEEKKKETKTEERLPVRVEEVIVAPISRYIFVDGTLESRENVDLFPKITGYIDKIHHEEGDDVAAGDLLLEMEKTELELNLIDAQSTEKDLWQKKKQLEARVEEAQNQLQQSDYTLHELESKVQEADLNLRRWEVEFRTREETFRKKLTSQSEFDTAKYEYERAQITKQQVIGQKTQANLSLARAEIALRQAQLELPALDLNLEKVQQVTIARANLNLQHAQVRAPFAGTITYRGVNRGQLIGSSQKVFSLSDTARLVVRPDIPVRELSLLRKGQKATITSEEFGHGEEITEVNGGIEIISPVIRTGTVNVTIGLESAHRLIRPGLAVKVRILVETKEKAFLIAKRAIIYEQRRPLVYVVNDQVAVRRWVQLGLYEENRVEVVDGLKAGELVIVEGNKMLADQKQIQVVK